MSDQSSQPGDSAPPIPLFILGVARSGTSYMQELLTSHPQARFSYEGRIVREGSYLYQRYGNLDDRAAFDKLLEKFCECEEDEPLNQWMIHTMRECRDELFRRHREEPSFSKLIENIYMLPDPVSCWGNKMLRVEECPELLRHWPEAKGVILIRDPRAVYASQFKYRAVRIKYSTIYWNLHAAWTRKHATDPNRYLVVKYEDFVENAPVVLEKILKLAGIWDSRVAEQMLSAHPPRKDSLTKWRESLTDEDIRTVESFCFEEMKAWQYTPEHADGQRHMGVLTRGVETIRENARFVRLDMNWWMRKHIFRRFLRTLRG